MNILLHYVIMAGDAGDAGQGGQGLWASAALAGVFLPVETGDLTLVDGGVGLWFRCALGADVVIAVDRYCHGQQYPMTSAHSVMLRVSQAQTCQLARQQADSANVLFTPAVKPAGINDSEGRETARLQVYRALLEKLPLIRLVLQHVRSSAKDTLPAPHGAFSK